MRDWWRERRIRRLVRRTFGFFTWREFKRQTEERYRDVTP